MARRVRVDIRVWPEIKGRVEDVVAELGGPWNTSRVIERMLEIFTAEDTRLTAERVRLGHLHPEDVMASEQVWPNRKRQSPRKAGVEKAEKRRRKFDAFLDDLGSSNKTKKRTRSRTTKKTVRSPRN